ncbi:SAM-dependent methyltransferase [Rubricella aquisinus]|uniref:SAM-dependent methyltransferase n=1 Tax=Rubricella aquisinus TaxID=2028108 RepID=A0A840WK30_9RHOB|nr:methyltransferase domain-containing protein [Rubricella aquisinus]MBB5514032.1 SAM-dependent methyltransferase [Rubricella aquisinus]
MQRPDLFDTDAITRARLRADRTGFASFLQDEAIAEVQERLKEVNRTFTSPAIVGPRAADWAKALGLPDAKCVADEEVLALNEASHDLVISALCLHVANDPVGQLVQMRRALKPDGLLLAPLFGGETLAELRDCLSAAEVEVTGGLAPRMVPMGEIRDLGALLQRAGLALPVADSTPLTVTYETALHLMRDLRAMGEVNVLAARHRGGLRRDVLMRTLALYAERYGQEGRIRATFDIVMLTGWAPAENQQKPLRPGSAAMRLADALGTDEHPAGDAATPRLPPQKD